MKIGGKNAIIVLGLVAFLFVAFFFAQYMPLREYMDTESLDMNTSTGVSESIDENASVGVDESTDEKEMTDKNEMALKNEKMEKLQSISEETTNMTERINNVIKNSQFDVNKMTNTRLQELEDSKKNIMLERENAFKPTQLQISEIQNATKNVMDSVVAEKGVHIVIA